MYSHVVAAAVGVGVCPHVAAVGEVYADVMVMKGVYPDVAVMKGAYLGVAAAAGVYPDAQATQQSAVVGVGGSAQALR